MATRIRIGQTLAGHIEKIVCDFARVGKNYAAVVNVYGKEADQEMQVELLAVYDKATKGFKTVIEVGEGFIELSADGISLAVDQK